MIKKSAYIIPYRKGENGIEILVGQKQVVHYKAISTLKAKLEKPITIDETFHITSDGKTSLVSEGKPLKLLSTRLYGTLSPAGGKPTFFGGKIKKERWNDGVYKEGESPKEAAIREFKEELHLQMDLKKLQTQLKGHLKEIPDVGEVWSGVYYALDLDKLNLSKSTLNLVDITNRTIEALETSINSSESLEKIYEGKIKEPKERFPELHRVRWVSIEKCGSYLGFDRIKVNDYILKQLSLYVNFLISIGKVKVGDKKDIWKTPCVRKVVASELN